MAPKIVVTGATGFVGQKICLALIRSGFELRVITRNVAKAKLTLNLPCSFYAWNGRDDFPIEALENTQAVIHLAGESIADGRWTKERKERILLSRTEGTSSLIKAINLCSNPPQVLVGTSAIGIYGDRGDAILEEESSGGDGFLAEVCKNWELAYSDFKGRLTLLRVGVVLGNNGGALEKMLVPFRLGIGGKLAAGNQWMSWIHIDDLVALYINALNDTKMSGVYNAVSPTPVSNIEFTKALGKSIGRPTLFPVPSFAIELLFGEMSEVVLSSQKVMPLRSLEIGFSFKFTNVQDALDNLLSPQGHDGAYVIEKCQWVPLPRDEVFNFFSQAKNLEAITPEWLHFRVKQMSTDKIEKGSLIDYKLKVKGLPASWRTLIKSWNPPFEFIDEQLKGPYSLWLHTHSFEEVQGGTLLLDRVIYRVPLGVIGNIVREVMIRSDVEKIFKHRQEQVPKLFNLPS